jgi:hypothetical protein
MQFANALRTTHCPLSNEKFPHSLKKTSYFAMCQTSANSAKLGRRSPAAWSNMSAIRFFVRAHITPNKIPLTASTTIE